MPSDPSDWEQGLGRPRQPPDVWGQSEMEHYRVTSGGLRNLMVALTPSYLWGHEATPLQEFQGYTYSREHRGVRGRLARLCPSYRGRGINARP